MKRIAALLALIAAIAAALVPVFTSFDWGSSESTTVTKTVVEVPVPGPTINPVIDPDQVVTPAQEAEQANPEQAGPAIHEDAKDETPPGVTPAEVATIDNSRPPGLGAPQPTGGAELLSCREHFVRNYSDRAAGSRVSQVVLHYTVSDPGSLDAIRNLFDTPSFAASSHLLLEPSGRCELIVPYAKKAWTEGAFNSVSDSVEIVCCRSDPSRSWWLAQPILKSGLLASWVVDRLRANGLPPKLVDPSGCTPRAGYTDHNRLECGNSHVDVGANFPWDVFGRQVRTLYNAGTTKLVWQLRSGGAVIRQAKAKRVHGATGYTRLVRWMRGDGARKVRAAERQNGKVRLAKVTVPG